ncbi:hypothetical protein [Microbacterium sp. P05]|uniref:hypothetical protein n=1 Tax=Microbacterium sp. P05 TaxID=3366948 RepID=UPI00374582C0
MAQFVIALDGDPFDVDAPTVDVAVVTADDFDSPIVHVGEPDQGDSETALIRSYMTDHEGLTVRQAVGLFGLKGMYRKVV